MALILPTPAQAALQTPYNTFSPTSSPLTNTINSFSYVYDPPRGVWVSYATSIAQFVPQTGPEGAAGIPSGNNAARPGAPQPGFTRWNTQSESLEVYTGALYGWRRLDYAP